MSVFVLIILGKLGRGDGMGFGVVREADGQGKSQSKLTSEQVQDLQRSTYCECPLLLRGFLFRVGFWDGFLFVEGLSVCFNDFVPDSHILPPPPLTSLHALPIPLLHPLSRSPFSPSVTMCYYMFL